MSTEPATRRRRRLLCVCWEFPPQATPTAIRTGKLLGRLAAEWELDVVTAAADAALPGWPDVRIRRVPPPGPSRWRKWLGRVRLSKLSDLTAWVDDKRAWAGPATAAALALVAEHQPDAIAVFMMPYTAGLVGLELKRRTGLPVLMNFDDSPTCDDMHAFFATAWHHRRAVALEDQLVQASDAVVYVSQRNLERVRDRQPSEHRGKFHLVRYGADPPATPPPPASVDGVFRIVYVGGMSGWHAFDDRRRSAPVRVLRRLLGMWDRLGRRTLVQLDQRGSTPVFVGQAARQAMRADPTLRIRVEVYGNRYPQAVVDGVLAAAGVGDVVAVHGPVPNDRAVELARGADLLFLALPARGNGSAGGRISAKTYEYLTTDRPILAAIPAGENADYLARHAGARVVPPNDVAAMSAVIADLARAARDGRPARFDRSDRWPELDYAGRAQAFARLLAGIVPPT